MMFKYSVTQWIFGHEDMEVSLQRLKKFGYDGVELAGEPKKLDIAAIQKLMDKYGMGCTSICGIYNAERDLSSPTPEIRLNAVQYVKNCVDMAVTVGASVVIVVPTPVGKSGPDSNREEEWSLAVGSLKEAGAYADAKGISLAIEALNRFETYLVNNLDTAKKLVEEVNVNCVGIMADLFHMNIEERNHMTSLRNIAPYLLHVHIADNTREAAGLGQTNFVTVMRTLIEIGYTGAITMEFMPRVSNPYLSAETNESGSVYDQYTRQSIEHIKGIMQCLEGNHGHH
ncbi:sugar phosphate isomerase/epimerase family protein [Paenibacillus agricola]|uniref:Sugar phosphate isomerase/epimerase n=1 Tax=Paenibacillus agricola TaxID=2716264 RepID=A0ABX0JGN2_9BACL|nr:sugar phosphate isomerase/epimerase family protein [Paenibacillus agricola]NHN34956.1 sugar phosphate isomerase/epimerase [Paenibacillus agricola]